MVKVFLSLGSNINAQKNISLAIRQIALDFPQAQFSSVYRSSAVGFEGPDFLNMVVIVETDKSLEALQGFAQQLEHAAGRVRLHRGRFDSRTLDVDVLMYGDMQGIHDGVRWPSDDLTNFAHTLAPMAELVGELQHPVLGQSFAQLWDQFDGDRTQLRRLGSDALDYD